MALFDLASDLHLEHFLDGGVEFVKCWPVRADRALILAGDITELKFYRPTQELFKLFLTKYPTIYYVAGNHEFFNTSAPATNFLLESVEADLGPAGFHVLNSNRIFDHMGVRIGGGTSWYSNSPEVARLSPGWIDHALIRDFNPWVYEEAKRFRDHISWNLPTLDLVVSHHLPSYQSVSPFWKRSESNVFFVHDFELEILNQQPQVWVHGHTHDTFDYKIGTTRIICNPRDYPAKPKKNWQPVTFEVLPRKASNVPVP